MSSTETVLYIVEMAICYIGALVFLAKTLEAIGEHLEKKRKK